MHQKGYINHLSRKVLFIPFCFIFLIIIKKSYYYWFNGDQLLKKAYDKYHNKGGKEKAALCYQKNKEIIKKREKDRHRSMTDIERNEK